MEDNSFLVGDRVVCESIVGWIGEIMTTEENADGETLYNIMYDEDESSHWIIGEHMVLA